MCESGALCAHDAVMMLGGRPFAYAIVDKLEGRAVVFGEVQKPGRPGKDPGACGGPLSVRAGYVHGRDEMGCFLHAQARVVCGRWSCARVRRGRRPRLRWAVGLRRARAAQGDGAVQQAHKPRKGPCWAAGKAPAQGMGRLLVVAQGLWLPLGM